MCISRKLDYEVELGLEPTHSDPEVGIPGGSCHSAFQVHDLCVTLTFYLKPEMKDILHEVPIECQVCDFNMLPLKCVLCECVRVSHLFHKHLILNIDCVDSLQVLTFAYCMLVAVLSALLYIDGLTHPVTHWSTHSYPQFDDGEKKLNYRV